jgi:DNA replication protein DnaC
MKKSQNSTLYKCDKCRDTNYINVSKVEGEYLMARCECYELNKAKKIWEASGIDISQSRQTFKSFTIWNNSSRIAKEVATEYYTNFKKILGERSNSIAFIGQVGSGKTHLSIALAVNFLKKGISVVYMPYRDVITKLKQNIINEEVYQKELNKYKNAKILLIDDLFKGKITESDINIMFEIVNHRYLKNMPIIISSEFPAEKLLDFDEAIGSRILEMCRNYTVEITGRENNYRLGGLTTINKPTLLTK